MKKAFAIGLMLTCLLSMMLCFQSQGFELITSSEYQKYVHTSRNSTYVEKPVFPVYINSSKIPIGQDWTIICPLEMNHTYHVYCYGAWVNTTSAAKTDYDIYVYDPEGTLESEHTEAAGFPEHLGSSVDDAVFWPSKSGNYTFAIVNDSKESKGAQQASFMIMEYVECNVWQTHNVDGKGNSSSPEIRTCWAYEFVTDSSYFEVYMKVPNTLDMYEARLYLMSSADSQSINDIPLPWEQGLYGNRSDAVGGYNFENEGYRGVAYASCEFRGQDMFLNYTSPLSGKNLYHLVFIGEAGSGDVNFLVKTRFGDASLIPIAFARKVFPDYPVTVAYVSNSSSLENATLQYTNDDWKTSNDITMMLDNRTCNATIMGQKAGTVVQYNVEAYDIQENSLNASGSYVVKHPSLVNITAEKESIMIGENITINGLVSPLNESLPITVTFLGANGTKDVACESFENGTFTASVQPETTGVWGVSASTPGTASVYECESLAIVVRVEEPPLYITYLMYIIGGVVGGAVVGVVVYLKKFRNRE